jgi:hypothetical protein
MPLIAYRQQRFNSKARKTVEQAKAILAEYEADGYVLTLRQLYYQFVARDLIPNTVKEYKRLGRIITDAREIGEIDWLAIEDRGRQCAIHGHEDDPRNVLKGIERAIRLNPWRDQEVYVESWVEKAALESVLARPSNRWRAPYMACKGYLSASEAWRAGMRFEKAKQAGKRLVLIHLGDHDPSGMDMTRDNGERLQLFARTHGVEVIRVALNMDQVEQYGPPPNPAKEDDSRFAGYKERFGDTSWELDALKPQVIDGLVSDQLKALIDMPTWEASLAREQELRKPLMNLAHRYDEIVALATSGEMPLERLARLSPLVPELVGQPAEMQAGLLDRMASGLMAEGLYASAQTRVAALKALQDVSTHRVVVKGGKEGPEEPIPASEALKEAAELIGGLKDVEPSVRALELREEATDMIDRLTLANAPTPAPERPGGSEPDEPEEHADEDLDELDPIDDELYGDERD